MRSARRLTILAVVIAMVAAVAVVPSLTRAVTAPAAAVLAPPPAFVGVTASGLRSELSLYSSSTGAVVRPPASFGRLFTDNGLAITPDGGTVYFTLIPPRRALGSLGLRLMALDVATGRPTMVADGAQPALSDDGSQLAYAAAPRGLAVRDLATGRTRTISLVAQIGASAADLLDTELTWLGDGTDVAFVAMPQVWYAATTSPATSPATRRRGSCGLAAGDAVVVFVHVPPPPGRLSARCVHLRGYVPPAETIGGDAASPASLLVADLVGRRAQVRLIGPTGADTPVADLGDVVPFGFDPSGEQIMYLVGHTPPALWEATIADGRLTARRELIADAMFGALAW